MVTIVRDPLVEDHIIELGAATDQECAAIRRHYEGGHLVLLRDIRFDLDFQFLNGLNFDVEGPPEFLRKIKKYGAEKIASLDADSTNSLDQFVFQEVFHCDVGKLAYFKQQVRAGNEQSDALYARLFPDYVATRRVHTWRLTSTMFENLHWDNFGIPETFQQVRIFTNIAASPRLWRTSHRIDHFAAAAYEERDLASFADKMGDDLNRFLNKVALGGMKAPCLDRMPKHHIAFDQGEVWLCETRIVCHQIYHGERAFAAMYFSDPRTMDRPELAFDERLARLHQLRRAAKRSGNPIAISN